MGLRPNCYVNVMRTMLGARHVRDESERERERERERDRERKKEREGEMQVDDNRVLSVI